MTPKLVIFDCDGVLVETESITGAILSPYFTQCGAPIAECEVHELFSGGTMVAAGAEAARRGAKLPKDWLDVVYEQVFAALAKGVVVFDGVQELLDRLHQEGIATAVASNGPLEKMRVSLGPSGLWDKLEGRIYSGYTHGAPKPAPDLLWLAAKNAGVDPSEAVMIDDTTTGIRAADAAGTAAIGFAAASDAVSLRKTGYPVAMTMSDVSQLLGLGQL